MARRRLLFLQLPLLDNDARGPRENLPFAAVHLAHAMTRAGLRRRWEALVAPAAWDDLATGPLVSAVAGLRPDVVALTLYLWNIERSLRFAAALRAAAPATRIIVGGPEVAPGHPLLAGAPIDAACSGDGEAALPAILAACTTGRPPGLRSVAWRAADGTLRQGHGPVPPPVPADLAPPAAAVMPHAAGHPSVFLESVRGCPLRCTYCRYHQVHAGLCVLPPAAVLARVRQFHAHGVRELRFVDPTFNAHPSFDRLLAGLARLNADGAMRFFAELRADTLTPRQADRLARANFAEIEIGIQSIHPDVLRAVRRPARLDRIADGLHMLAAAGVPVTLDVMYGLPRQPASDVYATIDWCRQFPNARVQCLQTLLLPGTALRTNAAALGLVADPLPPYGIQSTPWMTADDIRAIEQHLADQPDLPSDPRTGRFCAYRLDGPFAEQHTIDFEGARAEPAVPGLGNRRTLIIRAPDFFAYRHRVSRLLARCCEADPHVLWQFVLAVRQEEPLDVFEQLVDTLRAIPPQLLDRFASARSLNRLAARRIRVRLLAGRAFDPDWQLAVEQYLAASFA